MSKTEMNTIKHFTTLSIV